MAYALHGDVAVIVSTARTALARSWMPWSMTW